jgi:hypothetical protein
MALPLLALLLFAGDPPAADAPVSPARPVAASRAADADPDAEDPYPAGAPRDDFGMVAWCDGVLAGHMDLAERVQAVLPLDPETQKIGAAYLDGFEKALAVSKEGKTEKGKSRAEAARAVGWKNWDPARKADKKLASDSYLAWQMPGRCEHAAVRLSGDKDLFRIVPTLAEVEAMGEATPVSSGRATAGDTPTTRDTTAEAPPPPAVTADAIRINTIPDAPGAAASAPPEAPPAQVPAQTPPKKKGWFGWIPGVN